MSARPCAGCGFTVCRCARSAVEKREARIAALEAENARLEALILQINDDLGRTWDTGLVDAEALRIRSKR